MYRHRTNLSIAEIDPVSGQARMHLFVDDPELQGKDFDFAIKLYVDVPEEDGIDYKTEIYNRAITIEHGRQDYEFLVPRNKLPICRYSGSRIQIRCKAELRPTGIRGLISSVEVPVYLPEVEPARADPDPEDIMEPRDERNYLTNLLALSGSDRIQAFGLLIAAGFLVLVNSIIGIHDQITPDHLSWFYTSGDGDGAPLAKSSMGSGAVGAGVYFRLQHVLRRYMEFSLKRFREPFQRGMSYPLHRMAKGKSKVRLEDVEIRVVVGNIENGIVYKRGHKGRKRRHHFSTPARAVTVFRKHIPVVEARVPLSHYVKHDMVNFDRAFDHLYPAIMSENDSYGLELSWEIQLLHPELTDQELVGEGKQFDTASFSVAAAFKDETRRVA